MKKFLKTAKLRSIGDRDRRAGRSRDDNATVRASWRRQAPFYILAMVGYPRLAVGLIVCGAVYVGHQRPQQLHPLRFGELTHLGCHRHDERGDQLRSIQPCDHVKSNRGSGESICGVLEASDSLSGIPVINGNQIAVWCSTVWDPLNYVTRDVTFVAYPRSQWCTILRRQPGVIDGRS